MSELVSEASLFAAEAHEGQKRDYTGEDFFVHVQRVATAVARHPRATDEMIAAAYLHDTVEDTDVTIAEIAENFGGEVAQLVCDLTNVSIGSKEPRAVRRKMDRDHIATISDEAKIIKAYDRTDNLSDMDGAKRGFRQLYAQESRELAQVIGGVDPVLDAMVMQAITELEEG